MVIARIFVDGSRRSAETCRQFVLAIAESGARLQSQVGGDRLWITPNIAVALRYREIKAIAQLVVFPIVQLADVHC